MELYCFELGPICVPMVKTKDGENITTIKAAANALSISAAKVHNYLWRFRARFEHHNVVNGKAKEFLLKHKDIFGLEWVRDDLRLLHEDDILELLIISNNLEFRDRFKQFLSTHTRRKQLQQDEFLPIYNPREKISEESYALEQNLSQIATQIQDIAQRLARLERRTSR